MFNSIWAKISGALAVVGGILLLMLKGERSKRKAAEQEASIEKSNRQFLEKEKKVVAGIDKKLEADRTDSEKQTLEKYNRIEALRHEDDDAIATASIISLLNKNNRKDKD